MTRDIAAIREREAGTGEETWTHLADLTTDNAKWLARYADQADADRTALLALLDEAAAALRGTRRGYVYEEHYEIPCWCEVAVGNPMMSGHSRACFTTRAVLAKLEGDT